MSKLSDIKITERESGCYDILLDGKNIGHIVTNIDIKLNPGSKPKVILTLMSEDFLEIKTKLVGDK